MGGRGTDLPYSPDWWFSPRHILLPHEQEDMRRQRGYTLIRCGEQWSGNSYLFFDEVMAQTRRRWHLISFSTQVRELLAVADGGATAHPDFLPDDTFGMSTPTLRWIGDGKAYELYFDGLSSTDFFAASGLEIDMTKKGGFVASKRLSRALRPFFVKGFFPKNDLAIHYKTQNETEAKQWDGAGAIDRKMLARIPLPTGAPSEKQAALQREVAAAQRVEVTLVTARGEDKCHAVVVDDLRGPEGKPVDFVLPQDTKAELRLHGDKSFVAVNVVHGHDHMRLDVQSLLHLYAFFGGESGLSEWLADSVAQIEQALLTGDLTPFFRLTGEDPITADLNGSPAYELLLRGLSANQLRFATKSLMKKVERTLASTHPDKFRFPIPGGRYYVMTTAVAKEVGALRKRETEMTPGLTYTVETTGWNRRPLDVPQGEVLLDQARSTIWVNAADWVALPDGAANVDGTRKGIADILGGADQDDGCWVVPFTDSADGQRKVLVWRSPNQQGEYVVLKPHRDNPELVWTKADGQSVSYPSFDSRLLPTRIDHQTQHYSGSIDPDKTGDVGQGRPYSVENMVPALEQGRKNAGVLGMYCNALMLSIAIDGKLPDTLPAPLEMVIDGTVKTGVDLSVVRAWCYAHSRDLLERGVHIPVALHRRLSVDRSRPPWDFIPPALDPVEGDDFAFDRAMAMKETYRIRLQTLRETYIDTALPPRAIFEFAFNEPRWLQAGADFNRLHTIHLREFQAHNHAARAALSEQAEQDTTAWLDRYDATQRYAILRAQYARDAWRDLAAMRASGMMTYLDYATALERAEHRIAHQRDWQAELQRLCVKERLKTLQTAYDEVYLDGGNLTETQHHLLRERLTRYLDQFPAEAQDSVLVGAIASLYTNPDAKGDGGLWLLGEKADVGYLPGIAQRTMNALYQHGIIGERIKQAIGFSAEPASYAEGVGEITDVWYEMDQRLHERKGYAARSRQGFSPKRRRTAQARVAQLAARINAGIPLDLTVERIFVGSPKGVGETLMAYTPAGTAVGKLRQSAGHKVQSGDTIRLHRTFAKDGNLKATFQRLVPSNTEPQTYAFALLPNTGADP